MRISQFVPVILQLIDYLEENEAVRGAGGGREMIAKGIEKLLAIADVKVHGDHWRWQRGRRRERGHGEITSSASCTLHSDF